MSEEKLLVEQIHLGVVGTISFVLALILGAMIGPIACDLSIEPHCSIFTFSSLFLVGVIFVCFLLSVWFYFKVRGGRGVE